MINSDSHTSNSEEQAVPGLTSTQVSQLRPEVVARLNTIWTVFNTPSVDTLNSGPQVPGFTDTQNQQLPERVRFQLIDSLDNLSDSYSDVDYTSSDTDWSIASSMEIEFILNVDRLTNAYDELAENADLNHIIDEIMDQLPQFDSECSDCSYNNNFHTHCSLHHPRWRRTIVEQAVYRNLLNDPKPDDDFDKMFDNWDLQSTDMTPSQTRCLQIFEPLLVCIFGIFRATDMTTRLLHVTSYLQTQAKGSLIVFMTQLDITKLFTDLFLDWDWSLQASFMEHVDSVDSVLEMYDTLRNSPLFERFSKCMFYLLSIPLFNEFGLTHDKLGYSLVEAEMLKRKHPVGADMFHFLMSSFTFLLRQGVQIMSTGCWDGIYHSGSTYTKFFDKVSELKRAHKHYNNLEAIGTTENAVIASLLEQTEFVERLKSSSAALTRSEERIVNSMHNDLIVIHQDILSKRAAKRMRKAPFGVEVFGDPAIGKSTIVQIIFLFTAAVLDLPNGDEFLYVKNALAKFWDNFNTSVWAILLDDVASIKRGVQPGVDESLKEVIQINNSIPHIPDQAALEDKGRTPMRPRLLMATTNVKNLNIDANFSNQCAAHRRLGVVVTPVVRPEFATPDGGLDPTKARSDATYPDFWLFTVEKVKTKPDLQGRVQFELLGENLGMPDFLALYKSLLLAHEDGENVTQESVQKMREASHCEVCKLPSDMCLCPQSLDTIVYMSFWTIFIVYMTHHFAVLAVQYWFVARLYMFVRRNTLWLRSLFPQPTRPFWYNMGERVRWNAGYTYLVSSFLAGVSIAYTLTRIRRFAGTLQSPGKKPEKDQNPRPNVWVQGEYNLDELDLTTRSKCSTYDSTLSSIARNVACFEFDHGPAVRVCRATNLGGQVWLTNNHCVPEGDSQLTVTQTSKDRLVNPNRTFLFTESQVRRFPEEDLALITLSQMPHGRRLVELFAPADYNTRSDGVYVSRGENGQIDHKKLTRCNYVGQTRVAALNTPLDTWSATVETPTENGDCGMPMMVCGPTGYAIVAIHSLGHGQEVRATKVTHEFLIAALKDLPGYDIQAGVPNLSSAEKERVLTTLHHKSPVRFLADGGSAHVYGTFKDGGVKPRSRVEPTPAAKILETEYGHTVTHCAPDMKTWRPKHRALKAIANPVSNMRHDVLSECVESFTHDILANLPRGELDKIHVLDDHSAINGAEGVRFIDSIRKNTSMGNPWKKPKHYFLHPDPTEELPHAVKFDEETTVRIFDIERQYLAGKTVMPNFCAHLKDEPVTHKKYAIGKTRVFCGAPVDYSIVVRKYLLTFVKVVQENRFTFESAPGLICQSKEWDGLHTYLTEFGEDRVIAGDFVEFDKRMQGMLIGAAYQVIYNICKAAGYSEEELLLVQAISADTSFPLVDYFGDLYKFFGFNPSGHPLTVIVNGLANSLYMRYTYRVLNPEKECRSFTKHVNLMTYGDDNICNVSPEIDWWNHTSIQAALKEIGVDYTMAEKTAESVPFIHLRDATFLKRTFRFEAELDAFVCPLDEASIKKSLMTWVRSKIVCPQEQFVSVVTSAVHEYFWYGREVFEEKRTMLQRIVTQLGYDAYVHDAVFPTWGQLIESWRDISAGL